jgi:O26-antigen biosynthesis N-acetyl-L-fucosamine transferase
MKVLIVVVYYLPSTVSCAKLIHDLAGEMINNGHEVSVVTTDESITGSVNISNENGMQIVRVQAGRIKSASRPLRLLNECMLSFAIWRKAKKFFINNTHDLIIYYSPTIFFGPLVKKLKKLYSCPSYLVLRDIFPQWALDSGVLKKGPLYSFFKWIENINYKAADFIGLESPGNLDYFVKNFPKKQSHVELLYNWTTLTEEKLPATNFRQKLGLENKVVFFYGGNIGVVQDMDNIIRLAVRMKNEPGAYFLFVGDGSEVDRLELIIKKEGLSNISIHPPVDQQTYLSMLEEFDVGLITLDRNLKTYNFPGKMLGYMYHSMPILASINTGNDLKSVLDEHQAGLVSINGNDDDLHSNALMMLNDESLRQEIGHNGQRLLKEMFSVNHAAKQIMSHFQ